MTDPAIPDGFTRHTRSSPLTEPWEPIYSRTADRAVLIGLRLARPHTNSRGLAHGGLITALADNAMGLSCSQVLGGGARLLTVNLAVDFVGSAQVGQWLQVDSDVIKTGSRLCFAQALITADGVPCARANGTFSVAPPRPDQPSPNCQSVISVARSMNARTFADSSRDVA
ncbi:PaaI family thioesterase [soil metagenome]